MAKQEILKALKEASDYISGEDISRALGMTRSAVWKHIRTLRQEGYDIEAHTRMGYKLRTLSNYLLPEEVLSVLETKKFGRNYIYYHSINSSNEKAKEFAREGAEEGTVVLAEEQQAGKGRLGRTWHSPLGLGLYLSIILRPSIPLALTPQITLLTALSIAKTIEKMTSLGPAIKWPNDILLDGKKVCGILTELSAEMDGVKHIVVGIGLNLNQEATDFPTAVTSQASSVSMQAGEKVDRLAFFNKLLMQLEDDYEHWLEQGFSAIRQQWLDRAVGLGDTVRVIAGSAQWQGRMEGIDDMGALLVRNKAGEIQQLMSGEVTLRPEGREDYDFGH
ncbi:biotin--[acetyl-CoA-carboxylase] ligase [Heliorestis acidaminivorans]|uniref:Bifunctional ligase/repressor BirA n=1 Tax=Heliorestis acidaminivorans TaxID=553427 RepID=A0A6I0F1L9_9FIRM|nr:biotin--[acetyl-CoA-carboxylase] ligase [Heliorestis acidaminivorans]KAB2953087.1 biotin--[acetyl-CoA-carboxylase] ligase [Heliorestis acidaminivorans]